jgi:hypothetical protein
MNNTSVGGGRLGLQEGVYGWIVVKNAGNSFKWEWNKVGGLNNIGLLINTWGKFT